MKRFLRTTTALLGLLAAASHAWAGDSAQLAVLGYSPDGGVFAFEEFGIQDGSGFGYSTYYFIDTRNDRYLPGTPIRVQADDERSLGKVRAEARQKAAALVSDNTLGENPGLIAALNPSTEIDSPPHRLRYGLFPGAQQAGATYTLALTERPFPAPKDCLNMVGTFTGFSLAFTEERGEPSTRILHEDAQVPASRRCPNGYRIGAVVVGDGGSLPAMAMILVSSFGFEGNDERWIAVPIPDGPRP